jgi:hypothetical protein
MKGLCEYVLEASTDWNSGAWTGSESAAYSDYLNTTIHEDQLTEEGGPIWRFDNPKPGIRAKDLAETAGLAG